MKVQFTTEAKRIITVSEMPAVRKLIEEMKQEEWTVAKYAEMAARLIADTNGVRILEATAVISKNCRAWDCFFEGSANLDIWIVFTAYADKTKGEFIMAGAYLTDIWSIGPEERKGEIMSHMYIRRFEERT